MSDMAAATAACKGVAASEWVAQVEASRPAFLKMLQAPPYGFSLKDRQGIANKLAKAKREGRL